MLNSCRRIRRADALELLAESFLQNGAATLSGGAIRFLRPDGESFDSTAPGHSHPMSDWRELPR